MHFDVKYIHKRINTHRELYLNCIIQIYEANTTEHADMQSTSQQQQQQQQKTKYILYACFRNKMKYCIKIYKHPPHNNSLHLVHCLYYTFYGGCGRIIARMMSSGQLGSYGCPQNLVRIRSRPKKNAKIKGAELWLPNYIIKQIQQLPRTILRKRTIFFTRKLDPICYLINL